MIKIHFTILILIILIILMLYYFKNREGFMAGCGMMGEDACSDSSECEWVESNCIKVDGGYGNSDYYYKTANGYPDYGYNADSYGGNNGGITTSSGDSGGGNNGDSGGGITTSNGDNGDNGGNGGNGGITSSGGSNSVDVNCNRSDLKWFFSNDLRNETDNIKLYKIPSTVDEGLPVHYPKNTIQNNTDLYYFKFTKTKSFIELRNLKLTNAMTLGFYITGWGATSDIDYTNILTISQPDKKNITMSYNKSNFSFKYDGKDEKITHKIGDINSFPKSNKTWVVLKIYNNTITININNDSKKIRVKDWSDLMKEDSTVTTASSATPLKKLRFNSIKFSNFDGYIGRIMLWKMNINDSILCSYYQCYKNYANCTFSIESTKNGINYDNWLTWDETNGINKCIETCKNENPETCNIKDCQTICLKCQDNNTSSWSITKKQTYCPWFKNTSYGLNTPAKIVSINPIIDPNDDASIILEWESSDSKLFKITNYVIEIKESYTNQNYKIILLNDNENSTNTTKQYRISELKKNTSYDIFITAKNDIGIGEKSEKISIKTLGINNNISDIYNDINSFNYNKSMKCKNSNGHILDTLNVENIDILKSMNQ